MLLCQQACSVRKPSADTLEAALAYAYVNNPQLNSQRALVRATDEERADGAGRLPAAGRRRRPTSACSRCRPRSARSARPRRSNAPATLLHAKRRQHPARRRRHRHAEPAQRLPDRQPHAAGREPGVCRARDAAQHRADRAAQRRHRLHEPAARRRHPRTAAQQPRRADRAVAPDQGAAGKRQRHRHRRVAVGGAPQRRPHPVVHRRSQLCELARGLPAGDRARSGPACAGVAGRPLHAEHAARRHGRRHRAKPRRHHRAAQRRHRHASGQGRRGRALSDVVAARQRAEELRDGAELAAVVHRRRAALQYSAPLYQGGAEYAAIRQAKETQGQKQLDLSVARDQARMARGAGLGAARSRQAAASNPPRTR